MDERPEQSPEGRLLGLAQKRSPLSARKAAEVAGMSEGRWRQIVSGYQTVSRGVYAPVRAPAETVARMSRVVSVTPEELEAAGRPDAAEELRSMLPPPVAGTALDAGMQRLEHLVAEATALMDQIEAQSADQKAPQIRAIRVLIEGLGEGGVAKSQDRS